MWSDGRTAPLRSKASNRCPGCARAVAFENMTMLRIDAEENSAPGFVLTLTSREPVTDAAAYSEACRAFWVAFRRTWGAAEFCGFVEWTTGEGRRSGGLRRLHSHWLVKTDEDLDVAAVQAWASDRWRRLTGAWVVEFAALETVGGVVGYLALHHEKASQAPPEGWTGRRLRPSKGYFATDGRTRRERARLWLAEYRARELDGLDEGAMLNRANDPAPRLVWGRTESVKASDSTLHAAPGEHFGSIARRRELDAQLLRETRRRAALSEPDRLAERWEEFQVHERWDARSRRQRRRELDEQTNTENGGDAAQATGSLPARDHHAGRRGVRSG